MSLGRRPPVCKRRGCDAARERWQLVCAECWSDVQAATRARYAKARRLKLTRIAKQLGAEILRTLGHKSAAPDAASQAYERTAAMLGEREPAE